MRNTNKISHPLFILSILVLILNDWYFKATFHNGLTGKLSDFAGLFAFPYLFSALYPTHSTKIHLGSALLFIFWKSEFSQPLIDVLNGMNVPVNRTVDLTDYLALPSIVVSYITLKSEHSWTIKPGLRIALIVLSCLSFIATSLPPRTNRQFVDIDKKYEFPFSKHELVSRLNMVQMKEVRELNRSVGPVDFDSERNTFHFRSKTDTLAMLIDYQKIHDQDTIEFKTSFARAIISGDEKTSSLRLLTVSKVVPALRNKDYRDQAIRQFEKRVIKAIKYNH